MYEEMGIWNKRMMFEMKIVMEIRNVKSLMDFSSLTAHALFSQSPAKNNKFDQLADTSRHVVGWTQLNQAN